uniref:Uncharacterized protein n=1 Tax=Oryza punctata TaxID=4537 RepID=A0A0E0LUC1_ORYPU
MPTTGLQLRTIDYSTPRFCHVTDQDFEYVTVVDHSRMNLSYATYASRPFRPRSEILYLSQPHAIAGGSEVEHTGGARTEDVPRGVAEDGSTRAGVPVGGAVAQDYASLDDWMWLSASSSQGTMGQINYFDLIKRVEDSEWFTLSQNLLCYILFHCPCTL